MCVLGLQMTFERPPLNTNAFWRCVLSVPEKHVSCNTCVLDVRSGNQYLGSLGGTFTGISQAGAYQGAKLVPIRVAFWTYCWESIFVAFWVLVTTAGHGMSWPRFQFTFWLRFESCCLPLSVKISILELRFEFCDLRSRTLRFGAACEGHSD